MSRRLRVGGAVLTGGASRRMGRNKALLPIDGVPMAGRVASALDAAGCTPVVAAGGDDRQLSGLGLPVLADRIPGGRGPAAGVHAALVGLGGGLHEHAPVDGVVVVACDLPDLGVEHISALLDVASGDESHQVVVARTGRIEPTCAYWRTDCAVVVEAALHRGVSALHRVIAEFDAVYEVDLPVVALRNVNTPGDLGR